MQIQNYLTAGLMTILLIAILSASGCVGGQPSLPSTTTGGGETGGGAVTGNGGATEDGLPLTDLTSTTEFVARYPGSVMLYHSTMELPEGAYVTIMYGTAASTGTVEAWYRDMLESSGWEFAMETSDEGGKNITYIKEDTQENVSILLGQSEEYASTSVTVIYMKTE